MSTPVQQTAKLKVKLPAGGEIPLKTREEVDLWNESMKKYIDDYQLIQQNDLNLLGAVLIQQVMLFRCQLSLSGMQYEVDAQGMLTGAIIPTTLKAAEIAAAQKQLVVCSDEIQKIEKSLGIDKKTREAGGQHTVQNYVLTVKAAGREYGLHLSKRLTEYERVVMDARMRLRILKNADEEDRRYHNISPETICDWLSDELGQLEELDKEYAKAKQALYLGKV